MHPEEVAELPALLLTSEAVAISGLSKTAIRALEQRGELPTYGTGRRRIVKAQLLANLGLAKPVR